VRVQQRQALDFRSAALVPVLVPPRPVV